MISGHFFIEGKKLDAERKAGKREIGKRLGMRALKLILDQPTSQN